MDNAARTRQRVLAVFLPVTAVLYISGEADVTAPALVVMGGQDPDFRDPRAEADWIARALHAQVVMVPEAGHYPQSQRPDITTGAALRFLESVKGRG